MLGPQFSILRALVVVLVFGLVLLAVVMTGTWMAEQESRRNKKASHISSHILLTHHPEAKDTFVNFKKENL